MDQNRHKDKQKRLAELREAIDRLERELANEEALTAQEMASQHACIERLEDHFNAVETRFASLRTFWESLRQDLISRREQRDGGAK